MARGTCHRKWKEYKGTVKEWFGITSMKKGWLHVNGVENAWLSDNDGMKNYVFWRQLLRSDKNVSRMIQNV